MLTYLNSQQPGNELDKILELTDEEKPKNEQETAIRNLGHRSQPEANDLEDKREEAKSLEVRVSSVICE